MSNTVSIPAGELQDAVKHLHKLLSKIKPRPSYSILDVNVKLDSVELSLVGMSRILKSENNNIFSFTIPFSDLYGIALGTESPLFQAEVSSGLLDIGNRKIKSDHIKLIHPENILKFDLPINATVLDILSMKYKYSSAELNEKNYLQLIEKEETKLDEAITKASTHLSKYGVTSSFLRKHIDKLIRENSDS